MNKKTVDTIVSVVLGISVFIILATVISLLFDVIFTKDAFTLDVLDAERESNTEVMGYIMHSSIAVICVGAAMLLSYCLTYFTAEKKVFAAISATLTLLLIAMCLAFIFDLRNIAIDHDSSSMYTVAATYFAELIKVLVACLFTCAFFTVTAVKAFLPAKAAAASTAAAAQNNGVQNGGDGNA